MVKLSDVLAAALLVASQIHPAAAADPGCPNRPCHGYATTYCRRLLGITRDTTTTTSTGTGTSTATSTVFTTTVTDNGSASTVTSTTTVPSSTETDTVTDTETDNATATSTETDSVTATITASAVCGGAALIPIINGRNVDAAQTLAYTQKPPCFRRQPAIRGSSAISHACSCLSLSYTTTVTEPATTTTTTTTTISTDTTTTVNPPDSTTTTTVTDGVTTTTTTTTTTITTTTDTTTITQTSTVSTTTSTIGTATIPQTFVLLGSGAPGLASGGNPPTAAPLVNGLYATADLDEITQQPVNFLQPASDLATKFTLDSAGHLQIAGSLLPQAQQIAYTSTSDNGNPYLITYGNDANLTSPIKCRIRIRGDACPITCRAPAYRARKQKACGLDNSYYIGKGNDNSAADATCVTFHPLVVDPAGLLPPIAT